MLTNEGNNILLVPSFVTYTIKSKTFLSMNLKDTMSPRRQM